MTAIVDACAGMGNFQELEQIRLTDLVAQEMIVVAGKNLLAQGTKQVVKQRAGVENLPRLPQNLLHPLGIVFPVGQDARTLKGRTGPEPFPQRHSKFFPFHDFKILPPFVC
jgi:hypothetical protein